MKVRLAMWMIILLLISLFVYASLTKLSDYYNFKFGISESPYISAFAGILAWAVPATELITVVLILLPATRLAGLYSYLGIMVLFTLYISLMLIGNSDIPCSCGGVLEKMSWPMHIVFNCAFITLSIAAILLHRKGKKETTNKHVNLTYAKEHF